METLNPRLDVVFKLLFAAERNRGLLIALLNDVLRPKEAFVSVEVINPEIEKYAHDDRGVVLDILVAHTDGTRSNIEMQAQNRGSIEKRALYHWARLYRDGVKRGDDFDRLNRCRVILFLSYTLFPKQLRLHSIFRPLEVRDGTLLSEDFEIHTVELTKLSGVIEAEETGVRAWAQFLKANTDEERRQIAMDNPVIEKANDALDALSQDPKAQALARWREDQMRLYRVEMAAAKQKANEEGLREGIEEGMNRGLKEGMNKGLKEGMNKGLKEGMNKGLKEGMNKGLKEGMNKGLKEGMNKGLKEGMNKGLKEGMNKGLKEGMNEGQKMAANAAIRAICTAFDIEITTERQQFLSNATIEQLNTLRDNLLQSKEWSHS